MYANLCELQENKQTGYIYNINKNKTKKDKRGA